MKNTYLKYFFSHMIFYVLLIATPHFVHANSKLTLENNISKYDNFKIDCYVNQSNRPIDIHEISNFSFSRQISNAFSFGYNNHTFWFHLSVFNNTSETKDMVLEFTETVHKVVDLYLISNPISHIKNGLRVPVNSRDIKESNPSFPLTFNPYETKEIYMKVRSDHGIYGALELKTKEKFYTDLQLKKYLYLIYFTAVIILTLYNLFLFFFLREKVYFYYIAYVTIFFVWALNYRGILLPLTDMKTFDILQVTIPLFFIFFVLFSQNILETKKYFPTLNKLLLSFIIISFAGLILMSFSLYIGFYFIHIAAMIFFPLLIIISFLALYHKSFASKIYLLALFIYIIGMDILVLMALGFFPYSLLSSHAAMIGSFAEILLFSLLLAYRINVFKKDSDKMQKELIEQQKTETTRLFHTVAEKTMALNRAKEELEKELEKKEKLEKHLKYLASTDPMTSLLNRRSFFDISDRIISKCINNKQPLSCLILDIDYFKAINDTYGHDIGDKVIQAIAKLMHENIRTGDFTGRMGGEEFAVLMPNTDMQAAYQISDRLRENIAKYKMSVMKEKNLSVTVSIGLASLKEGDKDIHTILKRSDTALYKAKESGRNKVCSL